MLFAGPVEIQGRNVSILVDNIPDLNIVDNEFKES